MWEVTHYHRALRPKVKEMLEGLKGLGIPEPRQLQTEGGPPVPQVDDDKAAVLRLFPADWGEATPTPGMSSGLRTWASGPRSTSTRS